MRQRRLLLPIAILLMITSSVISFLFNIPYFDFGFYIDLIALITIAAGAYLEYRDFRKSRKQA